MSPAEIAARDPQRTAYIVAETGQVVTYAELEADANRGAQLFRSLGLQRGDHIALLLENHADFFKICWAAQRSGLYFTAISWRLQQAEVEYIVNNCEARVFITSGERRAVVEPLQGRMAKVEACYTVEGRYSGLPGLARGFSRLCLPNQ
jgi:acyl-CoA synthetase (AMP-forming)/AMP-acid ligase II